MEGFGLALGLAFVDRAFDTFVAWRIHRDRWCLTPGHGMSLSLPLVDLRGENRNLHIV